MKKKSLDTTVLTPLRQDILAILRSNSKPLGAYDILNRLKKKRPNAEPPTVYRVLDFLITAKFIHRIEAQNTYVCCSHPSDEDSHKTLLFLCKNCDKSFEFEDKIIFDSINKFSKKYKLEVDDALIEIKGLCQDCFSS